MLVFPRCSQNSEPFTTRYSLRSSPYESMNVKMSTSGDANAKSLHCHRYKEQFFSQVDTHCNNIICTWVCVDCKSKIMWVSPTPIEIKQLTYNWRPHVWQSSHSRIILVSQTLFIWARVLKKEGYIHCTPSDIHCTTNRDGSKARHLRKWLVTDH